MRRRRRRWLSFMFDCTPAFHMFFWLDPSVRISFRNDCNMVIVPLLVRIFSTWSSRCLSLLSTNELRLFVWNRRLAYVYSIHAIYFMKTIKLISKKDKLFAVAREAERERESSHSSWISAVVSNYNGIRTEPRPYALRMRTGMGGKWCTGMGSERARAECNGKVKMKKNWPTVMGTPAPVYIVDAAHLSS